MAKESFSLFLDFDGTAVLLTLSTLKNKNINQSSSLILKTMRNTLMLEGFYLLSGLGLLGTIISCFPACLHQLIDVAALLLSLF